MKYTNFLRRLYESFRESDGLEKLLLLGLVGYGTAYALSRNNEFSTAAAGIGSFYLVKRLVDPSSTIQSSYEDMIEQLEIEEGEGILDLTESESLNNN